MDDEMGSSYDDFLYSYDDDNDIFDDYYDGDDGQMEASMLNSLSTNQEQTIMELYSNCLYPTIRDAFHNFLWPILIINILSFAIISILIRILDSIGRNIDSNGRIMDFLERIILIVFGYGLLMKYYIWNGTEEYSIWNYYQLSYLTIVLLLSSLNIPFLLIRSNSNQNVFIWLLHIVFISINECFINILKWNDWIKIRPNLMLTLMKSVSYFHETKLSANKKEESRGNFMEIYLDFLSYLLHPCTIVLGVWHPHKKHSKFFNSNSNEKWNVLQSIVSLLLSILFLMCSTCFIEYFLEHILFEYLDMIAKHVLLIQEDFFVWQIFLKYFRAYSIAIQFHYSHYFICFLAQSMFQLWNFRLTVTKPLEIEWPRSLVDVVVAWNIPMHQWLKRYVFQKLKTQLSVYKTILATYFISSYLHGFNFQIWSVLLTLGLLTQAEFKLRKRLALKMSACIESRPCQYDYLDDHQDDNGQDIDHSDDNVHDGVLIRCRSGHQRTEHSGKWWPVPILNLTFTLIALSNLAFLGATFDGQPNSSTITNVWNVWNELYFHSYIIMFIMFVIYKFI